jgi:hypothetical protein
MALPMKYLSGMHNQAQEAINAFTGMPNPVRKDPMRQIGAFLDQFTNKPVLSPGAIGTQNNISSVGGGGLIGTVGAMQALGSGNPGLQAALMGAMFPGAGAEPFEQEKPDEDQRGGPSDNDADNPPSEARSAARSAVERMVAASPMASARPVGGFQFGGTGVLAEKLRNSSVYQPPDRSMSELMREPDQYRPSSVPAPLPRLPRHAARHELMGSRPEPVVNDYQLGDYNAPQQRRPRGYGVGGGF